MLNFAKRMESICNTIDKATINNDIVLRYRMVFVLLMLVIEKHSELKKRVQDIESRSVTLNTIPTEYVQTASRVYHSPRGWGNGRGTGYHTGKNQPGGQLVKMPVLDYAKYVESVQDIANQQKQANSELEILQQYAHQFSKYRDELMNVKPRNIGQRQLQNVLIMTQVSDMWLKQRVERNSVLGAICGKFEHESDVRSLLKLLKGLDDKKGKIGRESQSQGAELCRKYRHENSKKCLDYNDCNSTRYTKNERTLRVGNYVRNSDRYQSRLAWIVGLKSVVVALRILRYVDDWKEKYGATNRLAYMTAANRKPYVATIVTSQIEIVGTIRHLETDINVYAAECLEYESSRQQNTVCYFLGKTGSDVIDKAIVSVDWYHQPLPETEANTVLQRRLAVDNLRTRLGYARNQALTALERRKEIAAYARKLIWLETMDMLDSKAAGNCLPGTIQFAEELGLPVPSRWENHTVDTRLLLRRWKEKGYGVNRLLMPAIDKAVSRVKSQLAELTVSCYVPSVVR